MLIYLTAAIEHHFTMEVPDDISIDELKHLDGLDENWASRMYYLGECELWGNPFEVKYIENMETNEILFKA